MAVFTKVYLFIFLVIAGILTLIAPHYPGSVVSMDPNSQNNQLTTAFGSLAIIFALLLLLLLIQEKTSMNIPLIGVGLKKLFSKF